MKIILSRKGFDSSNGGCASPIMPDGTMVSLPIPETAADVSFFYDDLSYQGKSYAEIINNLPARKCLDYSGARCHLDPDLRCGDRVTAIEGWTPAFGQMESAQGKLLNIGVQPGDLFLFFGWFRRVDFINGCYRYAKQNKDDEGQDPYDYSDIQAIFGYMQIGKILTDPAEIAKYYWHPHAAGSHLFCTNNTLYLPSDRLSLEPGLPGCGKLKYDPSRVLTMRGKSRSTWNEYDFLMPDKIIGDARKNSADDGGLYYAGIWQEIAFKGTDDILDWVRQIVTKQSD